MIPLFSAGRVFASPGKDSGVLVVGFALAGLLGRFDDPPAHRVGGADAGAADSSAPVVPVKVRPGVFMAPAAVGFVEFRVPAVPDSVLHVLRGGSPGEILQPVILWVAVEMAAYFTGGPVAYEGAEDSGVNGDVVGAGAVLSVEAVGGVAVAVIVRLEGLLLERSGLPVGGGYGSCDSPDFSGVGNLIPGIIFHSFPCSHAPIIADCEAR